MGTNYCGMLRYVSQCCGSDFYYYTTWLPYVMCSMSWQQITKPACTVQKLESYRLPVSDCTHSSVFRLSCRAKRWPISYWFTPNDQQVVRIFFVLIQPIRRALSERHFRRWFCLHLAADDPFLFAKMLKVIKMTKRNLQYLDRKSTQITVTVVDKCIICSVDVSLRSSGARTRQKLAEYCAVCRSIATDY